MNGDEPQNSADEAPSFPYQVLWAGYGNAQVTLRELETNAEEYSVLNETAARAKPGVPTLELSDVEDVLQKYGLAKECAEKFWLVCCFYLAPAQAEAFGIEPKHSELIRSSPAKFCRMPF